MASWYKRFIPHFSEIAAPLNNLTRKSTKFIWDDSCNAAWNTIKQRLISAPVLSCPDFRKPFVVQTDASAFGLGAVLTQAYEDGEKVICYLSRSLTRAERVYTTTERECLAVLWAVEKLRPYIEGAHFTVVTDHHSLLWLHNLKDPCGRLARWSVRLQQFDFDVVHRKGKEHLVPDALSRSVPIVDTITPTTMISEPRDKWYDTLMQRVSQNPLKFPSWRIENNVLFHYRRCTYPELSTEADYWKRVIPKYDRKKLLHKFHDEPKSGHLGVFKTFRRLSQRFYWPQMKSDVTRYVRRCHTCISVKPDRKGPAGLMSRRPIVDRPWKCICTDIMGPLPKSSSGYQYILSVVDAFSKFVLLFPLRKATSSAIIRHLENDVFLLFGAPDSLIVDNGTQFRSREFTQFAATYSVRVSFTALYHPQANPTERVNGVVKQMLRSYVSENHKSWDKVLYQIACATRTSVHEVTKLTPYFINFGREISFPDSVIPDPGGQELLMSPAHMPDRCNGLSRVYLDVRRRLNAASESNKKRYDLRRRNVQYLPNELVWRRNYVLSDASKQFTAKLAPKFVGPYHIRRRVSPWTYELQDDVGRPCGTWNAKDLKPHPGDHSDSD